MRYILILLFTIIAYTSQAQNGYLIVSDLADTSLMSGKRWGQATTLPGQYWSGGDTLWIIWFQNSNGKGIGYGLEASGDTALYYVDTTTNTVKWRSNVPYNINKLLLVGANLDNSFGVRLPFLTGATSLATDADGKIIAGTPSSVTPLYHLTHAQALDSAAAGSFVPTAWYHITDKGVYLEAVSDTNLKVEGAFIDSTIWEIDNIKFDFLNGHIFERCDKRGNCVGATFNVINGFGITDPISVFAWGEDFINGNTVKDAVFDLTGWNGGLVLDNRILGLSEVELTTEENFNNNQIVSTTLTISDNGVLTSATFVNSEIIISGTSNCFACEINTSTISLTGGVNAASLVCNTSEVDASGTAQIFNANFTSNADVTVSDSADLANANINASTVVASDGADLTGTSISSSTLTATGQTSLRNVNIESGSTVTVGGTSSINNTIVKQSSVLDVSGNVSCTNSSITNLSNCVMSDNVVANGMMVEQSGILADGDADISSATVFKFSFLTVTDTVVATGIQLWEGDTVDLSGTVNAINCKFYTSADLIASGSVFIEGVVVQNVSRVFASGSGSMSPAFICNQSTVTITDSVQLPNAYISSSVVSFIDSADCVNCWFYQVLDTFNGTTLDTVSYSIFNRNTFIQRLQTDKFSLTDGTQSNGYVLTSDADGLGTWQDPIIYKGDTLVSGVATAGSFTIPNGFGGVILSGTGTAVSYTLTLPSTPTEGQKILITNNDVAITLLSFSGNGNSLSANLTSGVGMTTSGQRWVTFHNGTWY